MKELRQQAKKELSLEKVTAFVIVVLSLTEMTSGVKRGGVSLRFEPRADGRNGGTRNPEA